MLGFFNFLTPTPTQPFNQPPKPLYIPQIIQSHKMLMILTEMIALNYFNGRM